MLNVVLDMRTHCQTRGTNQLAATVAAIAMFSLACVQPTLAQKWTGHQLYGPHERPGAIGQKQLLGSQHRRGYAQPVRIDAPPATLIAPAVSGTFAEATPGSITLGLQVGSVYRFEISDSAGNYLVYPTIEVIDRLYPPQGSELRFPIPIELTAEELRLAAAGHFVTRVIYVEDPTTALPYRQDKAGEQNYFEVARDQDPVQVAFTLGRPVAILRMGSRAPQLPGGDMDFTFGAPEIQFYATSGSVTSAERSSVAAATCAEPAGATQPFPPPTEVTPLPARIP